MSGYVTSSCRHRVIMILASELSRVYSSVLVMSNVNGSRGSRRISWSVGRTLMRMILLRTFLNRRYENQYCVMLICCCYYTGYLLL